MHVGVEGRGSFQPPRILASPSPSLSLHASMSPLPPLRVLRSERKVGRYECSGCLLRDNHKHHV